MSDKLSMEQLKHWHQINEEEWKSDSAKPPYRAQCENRFGCCKKIQQDEHLSKFCNPMYFVEAIASTASSETLNNNQYIVLNCDQNKPSYIDHFYFDVDWYKTESIKPKEKIDIINHNKTKSIKLTSYTLCPMPSLENEIFDPSVVCSTCNYADTDRCYSCPLFNQKKEQNSIQYNKKIMILTSFKTVKNTRERGFYKTTNRDFWVEYEHERFFYADNFWEINERIITDLSQL